VRSGGTFRRRDDGLDSGTEQLVFEHVQGVAALLFEILLNFDFDVTPRKGVAQRVAIGTELVRNARKE
jgi:hypothetical protein